MVRKKLGRGRKNRCRFCTREGCPRPAFVDYKDVQTLKKLCTSQGKLFSRKRSGNCAAFQRAVKDAVKRARFMALMPYVGERPCLLKSRPGPNPTRAVRWNSGKNISDTTTSQAVPDRLSGWIRTADNYGSGSPS